ncbi:unnamed protein product [Tuwongella immobilis]|uniref:Uncharacterized protein n=1 Tax=Tuwongella immobilis TaxID=692036 RepID=A0A6C2YL21_9BACT|nr:unnamed protein product [Tuwongella immobilis]VTS00090.1 unnamed protein product [Tuwongella immobilis]
MAGDSATPFHLAKFADPCGVGSDHAGRCRSSLSPGEPNGPSHEQRRTADTTQSKKAHAAIDSDAKNPHRHRRLIPPQNRSTFRRFPLRESKPQNHRWPEIPTLRSPEPPTQSHPHTRRHSTRQIRAVLSPLPVTICLPSGLIATLDKPASQQQQMRSAERTVTATSSDQHPPHRFFNSARARTRDSSAKLQPAAIARSYHSIAVLRSRATPSPNWYNSPI